MNSSHHMDGGHYGSGGDPEDGDNRTRNAKAQRRHREKRKAHLKALEESVQVLTAQLEDARRQLGQAAYFSGGQRPSGMPLSPQSKDFGQIQAENHYLRDENADLRRQLYSYRVSYGHPAPIPPDGVKDGAWAEVKTEQGFAYPSSGISPRRSTAARSSGGELGPGQDPAGSSTADGSVSNHSNNAYPPPLDHFSSMHHQRSRSRVPSSSSAPSASPYLASDPRSMDGRFPPPPLRYEAQPSVYAAPPPHAVPRFEVPPHGHQHGYGQRPDGHDGVQWPPEQPGPPPFTSYPMGFSHDSAQSTNDNWRQEPHQHQA